MNKSERKSISITAAVVCMALLFTLACRTLQEVLPTATPTSVPLITDTPTPLLTDTPAPSLLVTDTPLPATPTEEALPTEEAPTPTEEILGPPTAIVVQNAFCRRGPGTVYDSVTAYTTGAELRIDGRSTHGAGDDIWWRVQIEGTRGSCYISAILLELSGDLESVPVLPDPPTPTPRPTETITPTPTSTHTLTPSP